MFWNDRFVTDNTYFYFLPDPSSSNFKQHCNLAIRFANGGNKARTNSWKGQIIAINREQISGTADRKLFEIGSDIGHIFMTNEAYTQFIKALYGGKGPGEINDSDKTTKNTKDKPDPDELGGRRISSADNPAASQTPVNNCPPELNQLPAGLGTALCAVADIIMGAAISLANISFRLLLQATTLTK